MYQAENTSLMTLKSITSHYTRETSLRLWRKRDYELLFLFTLPKIRFSAVRDMDLKLPDQKLEQRRIAQGGEGEKFFLRINTVLWHCDCDRACGDKHESLKSGRDGRNRNAGR
ncbi:uncharacterized [Tachysurus ichikawai]